MIIVKLQGGLGNQMFQYALGNHLANLHGTKLYLDKSWFSTRAVRESAAFRNYNLDVFKISGKLITCPLYYFSNKFLLRIFVKRFGNKIDALKEQNVFVFNNEVLKSLNKNKITDGYWQSEKYFESISNIIREEFQLRKNFSQSAKNLIKKIKSATSVSIHVRRGDYTHGETLKVHGILPLSYYEKTMNLIKNKLGHVFFYVFTDDVDWCMSKSDIFGDCVIVSKIAITPGEELILMSKCDHHIIANSTFSWWGAWLNPSVNKIVIVPDPWLITGKNAHTDLIPENWIKVQRK